jgi:hypothetical protein
LQDQDSQYDSISPNGSTFVSLLLSINTKGSIMKNLLLSAFFALAVSGSAFAYSNSNRNNGGEQDNSMQMQQEITPSLAYRICNAAQPSLYPYTEMTTSQLYEAYQDGVVTITYLGADPGDSHKSIYRVSAGGGDSIISIIDTF